MQKDNHAAIQALAEAGYNKESLNVLKRYANAVTSNQVAGREAVVTVPNTREHQDELMKVVSAGQFFAITRGGALMTSTDMILALERKSMLVEAKKVEQTKLKIIAYSKIVEKAKDIVSQRRGEDSEYTRSELEALIKWKQGPFPPEALSKLDKSGLQSLWNTKYQRKQPSKLKWTDQHEAKLSSLKAGEVHELEKCESIQRAFETRKDYLVSRLAILPHSHQVRPGKCCVYS